MRQRERTHDEPPTPPTPTPTGPGGQLDALGQEAAAFLAASHSIINAALSGNSEAFLQANRQQGGQ